MYIYIYAYINWYILKANGAIVFPLPGVVPPPCHHERACPETLVEWVKMKLFIWGSHRKNMENICCGDGIKWAPNPVVNIENAANLVFNKAHGPQSISNRAHIFICPNRNCQKLGGPWAHSPISAPEVKVLLRMLQSRRKQRNLLTSQGTTAPIGWRNHPSYNQLTSININ